MQIKIKDNLDSSKSNPTPQAIISNLHNLEGRQLITHSTQDPIETQTKIQMIVVLVMVNGREYHGCVIDSLFVVITLHIQTRNVY